METINLKSLIEYFTIKFNLLPSYFYLRYKNYSIIRICYFSYIIVNDEIPLQMNDSQNEIMKGEVNTENDQINN